MPKVYAETITIEAISIDQFRNKLNNILTKNGYPNASSVTDEYTKNMGITPKWTAENGKKYQANINITEWKDGESYKGTIEIIEVTSTKAEGSTTTSSGTTQNGGTTSSSTQSGTTEQDKEVEKHTAGEIIDEAGSFIEIGKENAENKIKTENLKNMSDTLYNILLVVGIIAAIIVGLILGIKFILGSIEEKAEIKAMLIPYIIGCVVVFGAFTIWQIVVNLLQSV